MRADRLISMMLLLNAKGRMRAQDLARELEVSERTIYRDIEALSMSGVPIYAQTGTNGGISLDEHYRLSLTGLSANEVKSLFLAASSKALSDLGLELEDSLLKLFAALPSRHQADAQRMQQRFYIDTANWFQVYDSSSFLPTLEQAVWESRIVQMTYQPVDGHYSQLALEAYALVAKVNIWYLVGRKADGDWRNYRLSRIHELRLGASFVRDPDFDLATYWENSCKQFENYMRENFPPYEAVVRVDPKGFWFFPSWMAGRYLQEGRDDEGWTRLRVSFESQGDAVMRLLGLGALVEVLEPITLRERLIEQAKEVLRFYGE